MDALTYASDLNRIKCQKAQNYCFEQCDIRDAGSLEKIFEKYSPTHIVHFAAESHVDNSLATPNLFLETNILGTSNLLMLARKYHVTRFHLVSTDEVYGDRTGKSKALETTGFEPSSPYAVSKAAADMLAQSFVRNYDMDITISRGANTYGVGQHAEKFIPTILHAIDNRTFIPIYGTGLAIRNWLHVTDHVEAIWEILFRAKKGSIYNIAGAETYQNIELVKMMLAYFGLSEDLITFVPDRPGHDMLYSIDATRIEKDLSFFPKRRFEGFFQELLVYFQENG